MPILISRSKVLEKSTLSPRAKKLFSLSRIERNTIEDNIIKDLKNFLILKKEYEGIEDRVIRIIRIFESEEENFSKPVRICNAFSNNYIDYETNVDKSKTLSVKEYCEEIKPYFKKYWK